MFDFIGLFIGFAICAILASLFGLVFGLAAWLILRRQVLVRFLLALIAATIPVASLFYMAGLAVLFSFAVPGQSELLFNGVSEELPNGYRLTALGKMPEFGDIEPIDKHHLVPQLREPVGKIDVQGAMVFGAYSKDFGQPDSPDHGYFAFNTETSDVTNFTSIEELNKFAGNPVRLVDNRYYHSKEHSQIVRDNWERAIWLVPPALITVLYFALLIRFRKSKSLTEWLCRRFPRLHTRFAASR